MNINIRRATLSDAQQILDIYAPYITDTAITYELKVPTLSDFSHRIAHTLEKYPYLVAESEGHIVGYAYASVFKDRRAYDCSCETSIYINKDYHGNGIGKLLYAELERQLIAMGITNMYACIAYTEHEDEYLTNASVHFHQRLGFTLCGTFHRCAQKFHRTYDMVWMEKFIG